MICPICRSDKFVEIASSPMSEVYGWSIKECYNCGYKVKDRTSDGRFAGVIEVLRRPYGDKEVR